MKSRRRFIYHCSAWVVAAAAVPAVVGTPRANMLGFETFRRLVNTRFTVRQGDTLELVKMEGNEEIFSLMFLGDPARQLEQNTYSFEHDKLGQFEMFIVPVGRADGSSCYYEAVFNLKAYG